MPLFIKRISSLKSLFLTKKNQNLILKSLNYLDYSRAEVASDARHRVRSCGPSPQVSCNEADGVSSARLNGKKWRL